MCIRDRGYAEGLKECINDDAQSRDFYCEVIMDEADKMNQMVKKLLTLNQLESGNETITMERFDVTELIRGCLLYTSKDAQNYTIGFRSKLRQFAFKIYIEQLPNGIIDFIKRVQSVEKTTYQVIAIIHDRDIKLDVHDWYAEARLKPHIHIIVRCTDSKKRVHVQTVMNMLGIIFRKGIDDALIVRNKGIDTIHKKFAIATTYLLSLIHI